MKAVLLITIIFCLFAAHLMVAQPADKPNIVLICIDDLGWKDLGYMGSKYYETPNIDQLANRGMVFTKAYANAANCAPTRACLLTGQYSPRHGVYTVANPARGEAKDRRLIPTENWRKISLEKITIAETLETSGYVSAAIGKWHVGNNALEQGFDYAATKFDMGFKRGHFREDGDYLAERTTDAAVQFITENKDSPFFLYLAYDAVHTPIEASKDAVEKYRNKDPEGCHGHAEYAAMIESVDDGVGEINQALQNVGLSQNTLLIFFSDNGGHGTYTCQKPLRGGKGMFYEGGIRVPMFAYWPSIIDARSNCDVPVIGTDFYPTFMELAGASPPNNYHLDGKSIVPLLTQEKSKIRRSLYWYFPAYFTII